MSELLKGKNLMLVVIVGILCTGLSSIPSANAQPYYDAYFTSIKVTHGDGDIELVSGGTAKVYDGQLVWKNLTFYNEACGLLGAELYTKIYEDEILVGTSEVQWVFPGSYGHSHWYSTEYGPATMNYKVEVWWKYYDTHYLEDVNYFNIEVVKLFVTNWSPATLSVEKGKTIPSTLSISFDNGGNDYMFDAEVSVVDSDGLEVSPQSQSLGDLSSGGTKSTSFSITAPATATLGTHTISFQIDYDDFRGVSHSETKTAPVSVTKLGTSTTLNLEPSSVKTRDSTTITATLVDGNENPIENQEITFSIGTTNIGSSFTDSSGNAVKSYTANVDTGTYVVTASYGGSIDYGSSSATSNLVVNSLDTTLTISAPSVIVGTTATITTTLNDENENPVSDANIDFYLFEDNAWSKISSATTNAVGKASITRIFNTAGEYQIKTAYAGNTNYNEANATATLTINQFITTLTIDVPSATQGKECTIKAALKDENGNPLQNHDVDFFIYEENTWKKTGTAKTDSNGVACVKYTPTNTGTFQFKAMFSGTTNCAQCSSTSANLDVAMDYTPYYIGGGILAAVIISVLGYIVFRRRKKATPTQKTIES